MYSLKLLKIRILCIMLVNYNKDLFICKYKFNIVSLKFCKYYSIIIWNYFFKRNNL